LLAAGAIVAVLLLGLFVWRHQQANDMRREASRRAELGYGREKADLVHRAGGHFEPSSLHPLTAQLHIAYQDADGDSSERDLTVAAYSEEPPGYVIGFCHLRRAIRTFRVDRTATAVDLETGELIPDLRGWLRTKAAESDQRRRGSTWN
jgi:hypothetical protein